MSWRRGSSEPGRREKRSHIGFVRHHPLAIPYRHTPVGSLQPLTVFLFKARGGGMDRAVLRSSSEASFRYPRATTPLVPAVQDDTRQEKQANCDRLLISAGRGDRAAFHDLYTLSSAQIFAVVRRTVWQRGEAEEVMQEVYFKIWRHAAAYDASQSRALTWMSRIARNHAIDHLRRLAARPTFNTESQQTDGSEVSDDTGIDAAPRPDEWLELEQQRAQVDRLLSMLSGVQRQVVLMSFREGRSQSDIAAQLGAPLGSVKSWMRRALQHLKAAIEESDRKHNGSNG